MKTEHVYGMTIGEKDPVGTTDYQGTTCNFGSEACRRKFVANTAEFNR